MVQGQVFLKGGRGGGKKETLGRKPHDFEKLRLPTNAASDWCGVGIVLIT